MHCGNVLRGAVRTCEFAVGVLGQSEQVVHCADSVHQLHLALSIDVNQLHVGENCVGIARSIYASN